MLSARELDLDQNPDATGLVNQRIIYTHGIGAAMVPVNEVASQGQPRLLISQPAAGLDRRRAGRSPSRGSTSGSGTSSLRRRRGAPARVRLPARRGRRHRAPVRRRAGPARPGIAPRHDAQPPAVRAPLPRPGPADQRPGDDRQPAPLPSHAERSAAADRAVPAVRQGPVSRHRRRRAAQLHPGRLHDERPVPARPGVRPDASTGRDQRPRGDAFNYIRNSVKIVIDAYDGTMTFYVADRRRSDHPRLAGRLPDPVPADDRAAADLRAHLRVPEELFDVQTRVFGRYHVTDPEHVLPRRTTCGPCRSGRPASRACRPRPTTWSCGCPASSRPSSCCSSRWCRSSRPNMIAWVAARMTTPNYGQTRVYRFPADTHDLRAGPDRGPDRPGPADQPAGHALGPGRQHRHPRQPHRRARSATR